MSKIPCKKCTKCGLYNDITVNVCECGTDITNVPCLLVDEDIPMELYGEIDEELTYYVQKCSACGALNFTIDPEKKVKVCYNCHKSRVYFVTPVPYVDEEEAKRKEEEERKNSHLAACQSSQGDEVQEEPEESGPWSELLGNIKQATGQSSIDTREEEEDKEVIGWEDVLGDDTDGHSQPTPSRVSELTLTSIRYGQISHTLKADDVHLPILLGRAAELGEFLMADGRVGNKHCYISYKNGAWYVTDNHSANGTAINQKDIGLNGERKLNNGDALKLGHHPDSMEFRVTIK